MSAAIPSSVHEEIDFLDAIEEELVALTTAALEGVLTVEPVAQLPLSTSLQVLKVVD